MEGEDDVKNIKKLVINKFGSRVLKVLTEPDIMITLKDFGVIMEDTGDMWSGLTIVNKNDVTITSNGAVIFKNMPSKIHIFGNSKDIYDILKEKNEEGLIVQVSLKSISEEMILDAENYNSVRNIYVIAKNAGINIKNDNDLLSYAVNKMTPRKRFVKLKKSIGKKAFEGSNVSKYNVDCIICYDIDFILEMKKCEL